MNIIPQPIIGPDGKMYTMLHISEGGINVVVTLGDHEAVSRAAEGLHKTLTQAADVAKRFDLGLLTPTELAQFTGQQPQGADNLDLGQIAKDLAR